MKLGMTKAEAQSRIRADEFTWADLAKIMKDVAKQVRPIQGQSSKISKGIPLAILYSIFNRHAKRLDGSPKGTEYEGVAVDLLREFGPAGKAAKRKK